jgi:arsenite methyltransferase
VGHFLDLAAIAPGDAVLDLGSGSGMDSFLAALATGPDGRVVGVDMTDAQLAKAGRLAGEFGFANAPTTRSASTASRASRCSPDAPERTD